MPSLAGKWQHISIITDHAHLRITELNKAISLMKITLYHLFEIWGPWIKLLFK